VASTTANVEDRLAALAHIDAAINTLDTQFPGVFTAAKDLVVSAREALSLSKEIEDLKRQFEAADLENATWLLGGLSAALAYDINRGPFRDHLRKELSDCWIAIQATHSDERVRALLSKHLDDCPSIGGGGAGSSSSSSSPSASDIASLRAAQATKVTLPPLQIHAASASEHSPMRALNMGPALTNIAETDKLLKNLSALRASDLGNRLLLREVADLIDEIVRGGNAAEVVLAVLGRGLGDLRLTHKDPEMRAELDKVLSYCFDQRDDKRAFTGEKRLQMRVEFLLREAPGMAFSLNKCRDDFAHKLVNDIRREAGQDSHLMLFLLGELDDLPGLDQQLKDAIHRRLADGSD
jgi:hypothetical protein